VPNPNAAQWFNPLLSPTLSYSPGTSGVGSIKGPDFFATDLSLRKYFKLQRRYEPDVPGGLLQRFQSRKLRFGGLGNATVTVGSGNFGGAGSCRQPRNVQFGLKFTSERSGPERKSDFRSGRSLIMAATL